MLWEVAMSVVSATTRVVKWRFISACEADALKVTVSMT
jgi:hypothetical protein